MHPTRLIGLVTGLALIALSSGCSVAVTTGTPTTAGPAKAPATGAAPGGVPAGAVSVDTLVTSATRDAVRTSAQVKGDASATTYDNALSLWAGCDGVVDQVTFNVTGHRAMQGSLGLRTSVADDLILEVLISVDGEAVQNIQLDGTDPTPFLVPVSLAIGGHRTVTTHTKVTKGKCAESADSYAVLVDGYVS